MSKPVTTIVKLPARAGKASDIAAMVRGRLDYIRAKPSNSGASIYAAADGADAVTLIEVWESVEAHQAHVQQMVEQGIYGPLTELMTGPAEVTYLNAVA